MCRTLALAGLLGVDMGRVRKIRQRSVVVAIGVFEMLHLFRGCCLVGCALCYGPPGIAGYERAWQFREHASETWKRHRAGLLKVWFTKPIGPRRAGFREAAYRGYGHWFSAFGEVVFDGVEWPPLDKSWPEEAKEAWRYIKSRLPAKHPESLGI